MDFRGLLSCCALAALTIAIWGHLPTRFVGSGRRRSLTLGLVLGIGAAASMFVPLQVRSGMMFDLRGSLIASSAFIGGPFAALVTVTIALICRISLSGISVLAGCGTIVSTAAIGLAGHRIAGGRPMNPIGLTLFSISVSFGNLLSRFMLPRDLWMVGLHDIAPVTVLGIGCTWLFVLSLQRDERLRGLLAHDAIYRAIFEALPDCLTAKDRDSRFLAANPATARLMGAASAADLIGKTDTDFYSPEMAEVFRAEERYVLGNAVLGPIDQEVFLSNGTSKWITSMKTPMLDQHGKVVGILTHNRDVTDKKRLEVELQNTQIYFQEAINHMADGLVLYDGDRRIRLFNRQYLDLFPKTADVRVAGALFDDIINASLMRGEYRMESDTEGMIAERIRTFCETVDKYIELADGRTIEIRTRALPASGTLAVFTDITSKKRLEQDLRRRASEDPLTRLANRATFEYQLDNAHQEAAAQCTRYAVMMLDLDRFKPVNDTYGHAVGDALLIEVARRLRMEVRDDTVVARLGGDEFAFLIRAEDSESVAICLANRLVKSLKAPFRTEGVDLIPGGSIGIAYFPRHAEEPFALLRLADKALYAVKTRGGGTWALAAGEAERRTEPPSVRSVA